MTPARLYQLRNATWRKGSAVLELLEEVERLRAALEEIADPIRFLEQRARAEGAQLDGMMAVRLAEDPSRPRLIARAALEGK